MILINLLFIDILPYQVWFKSTIRPSKTTPATPSYLIRQYFKTTLYDRLSSRPFLKNIEKLWLIFQLMKCLEVCHDVEVIHGDLKTENCLVTSWNWLVLSDFASFKPTYIPVDDPTDFQFYFDSMNRRKCYLAPERFYKSSNINSNESSGVTQYNPDGSVADNDPLSEILERDPSLAVSILRSPSTNGILGESQLKSSLTKTMDLFSLGCVVAEVRIYIFMFRL